MNKRIIIFLGGLAVLTIFILVYFLFTVSKENATRISLTSLDGKTISVKDFTKTSLRNDASALTLEDNPQSAVIMYNENSKIFTILIHANEEQEFNAKRVLAEQQFLSQLDVSKEESCKLNVEVSTDGPETDLLPFSKPQRLSFCK